MPVKDDFAKSFGKGRISGYLSIFFGALSFLAVLCFLYPSYLTFPDLRKAYPIPVIRLVLMLSLIVSFMLALVSFLLSRRTRLALTGVLFSGLAILMGGWNVQAGEIHETPFPIGLDWLILDLVMLAVIFIPIEAIFPQRINQKTLHEEWKTDLAYFVISHLLVQVFGLITQAPATLLFGGLGLNGFHATVQALPFLVQLSLAVLLTDVAQYAAHRAFHEVEALWRIHSIHHSTTAMDWLAGSRTHFVDIFVTRSISFVPVYLLGVTPAVFAVYIVFISFHAVFIHANVNWRFGPLKYVLSTPQFHHWHHADEPTAYNTNYAVFFPFIDKLFGTYYMPGDKWPAKYGVSMPNYPKGFIPQLAWPFRAEGRARAAGAQRG
ncbi:MAG TPA: sterol desaturase family protein [Blastocatellia bacterium]|nr:sterol desaturase family protein [Blastocatellia bacterium]